MGDLVSVSQSSIGALYQDKEGATSRDMTIHADIVTDSVKNRMFCGGTIEVTKSLPEEYMAF